MGPLVTHQTATQSRTGSGLPPRATREKDRRTSAPGLSLPGQHTNVTALDVFTAAKDWRPLSARQQSPGRQPRGVLLGSEKKFLKKSHIESADDPIIPQSGCVSKRIENRISKRYVHTRVYKAQKPEATQTSTNGQKGAGCGPPLR